MFSSRLRGGCDALLPLTSRAPPPSPSPIPPSGSAPDAQPSPTGSILARHTTEWGQNSVWEALPPRSRPRQAASLLEGLVFRMPASPTRTLRLTPWGFAPRFVPPSRTLATAPPRILAPLPACRRPSASPQH